MVKTFRNTEENKLEDHSNFVIVGTLVATAIAGIAKATSYPNCAIGKGELKPICQKCKAEAKSMPNPRWNKSGKKNYLACFNREIRLLEEQGAIQTGTSAQIVNEVAKEDAQLARELEAKAIADKNKAGADTMKYAMVGLIGVGAIVAVAMILKKK